MARVAPQPVGWSASVASTRGLGVTRFRTSTAAPSTAAPLVVVPVAYHARSSRRGRRANRKPRLSPDDRVESAVTVRVRRDCPGDTRVGMLGDGAGGVLGKWDTSKVAPMRRSREDPALWEWVLAVPIGATLEFKLVTVDPGDAVVRWSPGAAIRVDVPRGCAGVDVDIDWPAPRANAAVAGTADRAGAILSVRQRATVEKPLHEYRVETGGAWLAYGNKSTDDDDETETETEERTETNGGTAAREHDAKDALGGTPHARSDEESNESSSRVVVDALDAVDLDAEGTAEKNTAGLFVRADVSSDENDARFVSADENETDAFLSVDESSDDDDAEETETEETETEETEPEETDSTSASDVSDAKETREARRAAGYVVGSHLENMSGGKKTELVVNAADSRRRGIRVGVVEDGRLVETWYEDSAGPGEGMRVGDVYLGVVAKVIGGMQGVLVDVTGKGPPYSLMQKGVDEPALAWREADAGYERDVELERREIERARKGEAATSATSAASAADVDENNADEASSPSPSLGLPSGPKEDAQSAASDARLARLERKAAASAIGSRAGGRWADAWAEGVGVSDSFDGESVAAPSSAETVAASLETFAEERTETDGGVGVATTKTTTKSVTETLVEETRVPPPFAWAPWRRGGGASRAAEALNDDADSSGEASPALDSSALSASFNATSASSRASLTAAERRGGRGVVDDWVPGMPVVVQVTRLGSGHKGPRVTARPTLPGRNVVLCPDGEGVYVSRKLAGAARAYVKSVGAEVAPPDCALIMRTEAAGVSKEVLATDITSLAADWHEVKRRAEMAVAASGEHGRSPMPRRLLDAATTEQILVRDLFGERVARLVVDSKKARDAIVEDLRKTGATEETVKKVELWQPPEASENEDHEKKNGAFKPPEVWDALCLRDAIASAEEERVFLKDENLPGAHLVIQQTEALTAVDVNAGRAAFVNDGNTESVAFAVNVAAAAELAAQLRLRDVGGLVMIDFIDMTKRKHRRLVEAAFLDAAKHDRAQVTFLPISPLGVMEVARERLQGNHAGRFVVADEKGMPVDPDRPGGGPRRVRGPRPPPWVRGRGPKDGVHNTPNAATRDERARASDGEYSDAERAGAYDSGNARGFRGFRESSRRRERGDRGAVANHSGSFYGGARRGRGGGKARGGQKHAGSGDGA